MIFYQSRYWNIGKLLSPFHMNNSYKANYSIYAYPFLEERTVCSDRIDKWKLPRTLQNSCREDRQQNFHEAASKGPWHEAQKYLEFLGAFSCCKHWKTDSRQRHSSRSISPEIPGVCPRYVTLVSFHQLSNSILSYRLQFSSITTTACSSGAE